MVTYARAAIVALFIALGVACGHNNGSPAAPSGPPAVASQLLGTWSGIDHTNTTNAGSDEPNLFFQWTANQMNGDAVTGLLLIAVGNSPPAHPPNGGTMSLNVAGSTVTVSITVPPGGFGVTGNFPPGPLPHCSMTGTGSGAASATQIVVTVTTTFDPACANGALYNQPGTVFSGSLTLNKQ